MAVIGFNDGRMPVKTNFVLDSDSDATHFTYSDKSEVILPELSDNMKAFDTMFSIGDVCMLFGLLLMIGIFILVGIRTIKEIRRRH